MIELGPGTGVMTEALLAHGSPPDGLLVVELDEALHDTPARALPAAAPGAGRCPPPATQLAAELCRAGRGRRDDLQPGPAWHGRADRGAILAAAFALPAPDGRFIQFTYGAKSPVSRGQLRALGLRMRRGAFILRNLPPATVYVYTRDKGTREGPANAALKAHAQSCVPRLALV